MALVFDFLTYVVCMLIALSIVIMHTLDVSNLHLEYGFKRVLWDTCLHCETGQVVGILGRNGGGKSCLMQVIYGGLRLKDQYVAIDGRVLLTRERRPEDMRYLYNRVSCYRVCL